MDPLTPTFSPSDGERNIYEKHFLINAGRDAQRTRRRGRLRYRGWESLLSLAELEHTQIFAVPGGGDGFARAVGTGLVRAGGDTLLAQFADVPVLFVGHVPEFNGVVGAKVWTAKCFRMKKPVAIDERAVRRLGPDLMQIGRASW